MVTLLVSWSKANNVLEHAQPLKVAQTGERRRAGGGLAGILSSRQQLTARQAGEKSCCVLSIVECLNAR